MNDSLGNVLYQRIKSARFALLRQSELANLAYIAYALAVTTFENEKHEYVDIPYPIGWNADNTLMNSRPVRYSKDAFLRNYQLLALQELALSGIFRLVTIMETMLGDIVRAVVLKYPNKLGKKRTIETAVVLAATSIEDVHIRVTDSLLNELSYKSPRDFAREAESLLSCNLLECPAYHRFVEVKATRDIHIHNSGVANDVYRAKADSHARVNAGALLPVNLQYFLQSYESCLQLTEWLDRELHAKWPSSDYESDQQQQQQLSLPLADPIDPLDGVRSEADTAPGASKGADEVGNTHPTSEPVTMQE